MHLWLLIISAVLSFAVNRSMKQLVAAVLPPPIRLQFAWSEVTASKILEKWSDTDKRAVRLNLALDFVFILIYVAGLAVACALAANALDAAGWPGGGGIGGLLARAIIIAGLLDAVENGAQLLMLAGRTGATLAGACFGLRQHQIPPRRRDHSLRPLWWRGVCLALSRGPEMNPRPFPYSVRNATIGLTRVARRAGTKQEIAATKVSRPATTR